MRHKTLKLGSLEEIANALRAVLKLKRSQLSKDLAVTVIVFNWLFF